MDVKEAWRRVQNMSSEEAVNIVNEAFKDAGIDACVVKRPKTACGACQSYAWFNDDKEYHCTTSGCANGDKFKQRKN